MKIDEYFIAHSWARRGVSGSFAAGGGDASPIQRRDHEIR